jgi:putative transposase
MQRSFFELYVHLIWTTKNREGMLTFDIEESVINITKAKAEKHKVSVIAIGNTNDHIHVLISIHPDTLISGVVKDMKASASYFVNNKLGKSLYWQDGYGALSVSKKGLEMVKEYIKNQKKHHIENKIVKLYERT